MTVVDSSVWIDYFAGRTNPETNWLQKQPETSICVPDLVIFEVLQGVRNPKAFIEVRDNLLSFTVEQVVDLQISIAAAQNYRQLRQRGITIRSSVDVLIATFCLANGYTLLHRDRDYDYFERELYLAVIHPEL